MWPFAKPKPTPPGVIIRNVLGEEIDRVEGVWRLAGQDLRGRQWNFANLSGMDLTDANCEGINLWGARLVKTSFVRSNLRNAEMAYSNASDCDFSGSDMRGCLMWRTETHGARFENILMDSISDIPGVKVVAA